MNNLKGQYIMEKTKQAQESMERQEQLDGISRHCNSLFQNLKLKRKRLQKILGSESEYGLTGSTKSCSESEYGSEDAISSEHDFGTGESGAESTDSGYASVATVGKHAKSHRYGNENENNKKSSDLNLNQDRAFKVAQKFENGKQGGNVKDKCLDGTNDDASCKQPSSSQSMPFGIAYFGMPPGFIYPQQFGAGESSNVQFPGQQAGMNFIPIIAGHMPAGLMAANASSVMTAMLASQDASITKSGVSQNAQPILFTPIPKGSVFTSMGHFPVSTKSNNSSAAAFSSAHTKLSQSHNQNNEAMSSDRSVEHEFISHYTKGQFEYNGLLPSELREYREANAEAEGATRGTGGLDDDEEPMVCAICNDRATGLHYGIITCEGCKGFFKRTVQNKRIYTCVGKGDCEINKIQRNRCQFCRFKKCLEMGMVLAAVREDRMPGGRNSGAVYNLYKVKYKKHKRKDSTSPRVYKEKVAQFQVRNDQITVEPVRDKKEIPLNLTYHQPYHDQGQRSPSRSFEYGPASWSHLTSKRDSGPIFPQQNRLSHTTLYQQYDTTSCEESEEERPIRNMADLNYQLPTRCDRFQPEKVRTQYNQNSDMHSQDNDFLNASNSNSHFSCVGTSPRHIGTSPRHIGTSPRQTSRVLHQSFSPRRRGKSQHSSPNSSAEFMDYCNSISQGGFENHQMNECHTESDNHFYESDRIMSDSDVKNNMESFAPSENVCNLAEVAENVVSDGEERECFRKGTCHIMKDNMESVVSSVYNYSSDIDKSGICGDTKDSESDITDQNCGIQESEDIQNVSYESDNNYERSIQEILDCNKYLQLVPSVHPNALYGSKEDIAQKLFHLSDEIVAKLVTWIRYLPFYREIPLSLQTRMLSTKWHELLLLATTAHQALTSRDACVPSYEDLYNHNFCKMRWYLCHMFKDVANLDRMSQEFEDMMVKVTQIMFHFMRTHLSKEEYACLQVILLLNNNDITKQDKLMEKIQDQYTTALRWLVQKHYPEELNRFGEMLLQLPQIQMASKLLLKSKMIYIPFFLNS